MLDRQKIVNFVSAKLKEQGCKSYDIHSGCRYRHGELKCAVGHIIYEEYREEFECISLYNIVNSCSNSFEKFGLSMEELDTEYDFLRTLQKCHDDADKDSFYQSFLTKLSAYLDMQPETV
jgi:hypothetical protein